MAKIDHKHANRSAPIQPANCQATGYKCRFRGDDYDTFFYDTRLPFGGKSFPEIFHHITQSVRRTTARIVLYRKIPKISPGAYIFQRPFLRGLFLEGLIYGGKFVFQNRLG